MTISHRHKPLAKLTAFSCLIAFVAVAWLTVAPAASAAPSPILAPKGGSVLHKNRVKVEVRSRDNSSALKATLNGVDVTSDFSRSKAGIRTMTATISHGLRRGRNRLRVRVRKPGKPVRTASVRFTVRRGAPLVGAGRDHDVVVGSRARLRGDLRNGSRSKLRWRLVGGPRPAEAKQAVTGRAGANVRLASPAGPTAGFVPRSPGRYVFGLTHGKGRRAVTDRVTVSAVPPSPLVPVDTMAGTGIKVGDTTYPNEGGLIQTVVLDRKTLALDYSRTYYATADLDADLKQLGADKLVIVSASYNGTLSQAWAGLVTTLRRLGIDLGQAGYDNGIQGRWFSAIGAVGMTPGTADVRYRIPPGFPHDDDDEGEMVGYLTPDQYGNFGFVSSQKEEYSLGGEEVPPCAGGIPSCGDTHIGYRLSVHDPYEYEPGPGDGKVFDTNGRGLTPQQLTDEATKMADALDAVPGGYIVSIEAVSNRRSGETNYPPPVGAVSTAAMKRLAQSVADAGGTRNGFNHAATVAGVPASGGDVYVMVGWHGAGEGNGEESAAGVDASGDVPELSGVLRPDLNSMLRPTEAAETSEYTNELSNLALAEPHSGWPLDDNPGAQNAIAYLAKQDNTLSPDIRSSYWTMNLDINGLIQKIGGTTYPAGAAFSEADFDAAKAEILQELEWVGKVRSYLDQLSKPFSDTGVQNWAAVQTIGERIHEQAEADSTKVSVDWLEVIDAALELIPLVGPQSHAAAEAVEALTEETTAAIRVWGAIDVDGEPFGGRVVTANELGAEMANQARDAQASFAAMGDVIVSDYDKLKELGTYAGCNPSSPDCPEEWGLDKAKLTSMSASLYLDVERESYLKLLPLGYKVFSLARKGDFQGHFLRYQPPDPAEYYCNGHYPWSKYPDLARSSTSLLQELDSTGAGDNGWDTFVFSAQPGSNDIHGTPPSADILDRMFDPISASGNPTIGGLGLFWTQFAIPQTQIPEGQRSWWEFNNPVRERDVCSWMG